MGVLPINEIWINSVSTMTTGEHQKHIWAKCERYSTAGQDTTTDATESGYGGR